MEHVDDIVVPYIEQAMGFDLYDNQKDYLLGKSELTGGRRSGKTVAYCIKLSLSDGPPLDLRRPEVFSDGINWGYSRHFFRIEFLEIRAKLKKAGFDVREVRL